MSKTARRSPGGAAEETAHFVEGAGPLCARLVMKDGSPTLAPFKTGWTELRPFDRKCRLCMRLLKLEGRG